MERPVVLPSRILLTGASGYIGSALLPELLAAGCRVRCFVRDRSHALFSDAAVEVIAGDVFDVASLREALRGIDTAFYLIHSLGDGRRFAERDREAATNFASVARSAGVRRIIYLSGLGDADGYLSAHLRSRQEVGEILRSSGVQVIELRTSIVIGPGSLSFEMIRALTERLPVMTTPRWVDIETQPIGIADLVHYLLASLMSDTSESIVYEIGGADRASYGELMREYARQRRLRRWIIPIPLLTPKLSSLWLALVTPLYATTGSALIDGVRSRTVVQDAHALQELPVRPMGYRQAIAEALALDDRQWDARLQTDRIVPTRKSAYWKVQLVGTRYLDSRTVTVPVSAAAVFNRIARIGGTQGYYFADWLWRLRSLIDAAIGGVGSRRTSSGSSIPSPGEIIDFWHVEACEPGRRLLLRADMKLPGRAWLQFSILPEGDRCHLRQTAVFDARGLFGILYWWMTLPIHRWLFAGMLRNLAGRCRPGEDAESDQCALAGTAHCHIGEDTMSCRRSDV